jgi:N-acetylmuramoyl-L-alanine amidase
MKSQTVKPKTPRSRARQSARWLIPVLCHAVLWMSLVLPPAAHPAATLDEMYRDAQNDYRALVKDPEKHPERQIWERTIVRFREVMTKDQTGRFTDKCLFLIAQCHHHLYHIHKDPRDSQEVLRHYRLLLQETPHSNLADDAQFMLGVFALDELHDPQMAYTEFLRVRLHFADSDMAPKAAEKLAQLQKQLGSGSSAAPSSPQGQSEAPTAPKNPSMTPPAPVQPRPLPGLAELASVEHQSTGSSTEVVATVNGPVVYRYQSLPASKQSRTPARVHLDLKNCNLQPGLPEKITVQDGLLKEIRLSSPAPGQVLMVLDVTAVEKVEVHALSAPYRLVVELRGKKPTTAEAQKTKPPDAERKSPKQGQKAVKAEPQKKQSADEGRKSPKKGEPAPAAKTQSRPKSKAGLASGPTLAQQLGLGIKRIVLDPGHGGKDTGAISLSGLHEKDIVLSIAKRLKVVLEKQTGCQVLLTRTTDRFVSLEERTAFANRHKADMFISIHANAHENRSLSGVETYSLNLASDPQAARLAALENATSQKKMSDLEAILHELVLKSKTSESSRLARDVQNNIVGRLKERYKEVRDLGVKQAPFIVLVGAEMPAVLIETAFLSNEQEELRLVDNSFQETLSHGIATGVAAYIQQMKTAGN